MAGRVTRNCREIPDGDREVENESGNTPFLHPHSGTVVRRPPEQARGTPATTSGTENPYFAGLSWESRIR